jgi:hypothetical protein
VSLPSVRYPSFNVAVAGSILMYDRVAKQARAAPNGRASTAPLQRHPPLPLRLPPCALPPPRAPLTSRGPQARAQIDAGFPRGGLFWRDRHTAPARDAAARERAAADAETASGA